MGASAAQFLFAAEIIAFLVAVTGLALILLRFGLYASSPAEGAGLLVGFGCVAASAFLLGGLGAGTGPSPAVSSLRLAGGAVIGLAVVIGLGPRRSARSWTGALRWRTALLVLGAAVIAAGGVVGWVGPVIAGEALVLSGAVTLAGALALGSRGSIGSRLTASAAAILVLIVVVLSVSISTVLTQTVRNDALRRLQTQAQALATASSEAWVPDLREAKLVSASVAGLGLDAPVAAGQAGAADALRQGLDRLATQFFADVGIAWYGPGGQLVATGPGFSKRLGSGVADALAGSGLIERGIRLGQPAGTAGVAAGAPVAVAAYPDRAASGAVEGVAVVATALDRGFLRSQVQSDPSLRALLQSGPATLSSFPAGRPFGAIVDLAGRSVSSARSATWAGSHDLASAAPVLGGSGHPVMAAVMLVPTTALDHTRQSLFRTLFLIALGSSLIAFLLAMAVSNSISGGLGRLTAAAQRISTGETLVRTHLRSEDEIGQLAEAFDVMAESIEDQAAALRRAAQDEAELRARLQSVVAGMGEALVAVDAQGQVTEFNRAAERLVGRRRRNSLGRALAEVLSVQTPGGPPLEDRLRQSANFELTAELSTSRGTVPVLLTAGPLPAEGTQAAGWVLLLRDLRPEREVERMKSEFLSRVGHELRTPLTAILGFSQILAHRPVRPEQARVMHGEIVEQSNRLLRTVQMLEFFASAGANRLGLDPEAVRPRVLLEELRQRWSDKLPPTSMLSIRGSASLPALEVDRRWVGLALDELVDNAVKFGTDVPRVTVGASAVEGGTQLFVADQGPGMTATEAAAAFAEFVQGDSSDTRRFGGLGLGLPLVRRVVEAHGGTVDVVTEPGKGCRVQLFFPRSPGRDRRPSGAGGGRRSPS